MSPKDIAEKIINRDGYRHEVLMILARAYLDLENNHIAAIALINKNISTLRMWTNPNSYLGSELLDISNVNSKFLADNFTFQNSYLDLKSEITKLKEENEKLKERLSKFKLYCELLMSCFENIGDEQTIPSHGIKFKEIREAIKADDEIFNGK